MALSLKAVSSGFAQFGVLVMNWIPLCTFCRFVLDPLGSIKKNLSSMSHDAWHQIFEGLPKLILQNPLSCKQNILSPFTCILSVHWKSIGVWKIFCYSILNPGPLFQVIFSDASCASLSLFFQFHLSLEELVEMSRSSHWRPHKIVSVQQLGTLILYIVLRKRCPVFSWKVAGVGSGHYICWTVQMLVILNT